MANDKQELMKKADALRRDLSELDAQIAKMPSEPESVKPNIVGPFRGDAVYLSDMGVYRLVLTFGTEEQAEKAKATLEKMEFGPVPDWYNKQVQYQTPSGAWRNDYFYADQDSCVNAWHMGKVRER